ncbi:MAG TPA: tRNA (adenosine(37)-N6)-threonylcarbamoyltransferase complex dimerization subunit type 1 TsaB [Candidatus Saccharimonadales bacterium]|nr:tRNA (adenosine(37)-N6)-threonylcarbamoyltransferase complex dimerization subunit type 1 TsaB [Candidatus Saccharimonadales bacterium]
MLVLTLRTDNPLAEVGLFTDDKKNAYETWQAHRELADTIHKKIEKLLKDTGKTWQDIEGIVAFKGPGSFTGLRIGLTVANTLAYALTIPAVGETGDDWVAKGNVRLAAGQKEQLLPEYGAPVHITKQKK